MLDTIQIAKDLEGDDHAFTAVAAGRIAQALLKAHEGDPPVSRLYVDVKVAELKTLISDLRGEMKAQGMTLALAMGGQTLAILGGVYWMLTNVHRP